MNKEPLTAATSCQTGCFVYSEADPLKRYARSNALHDVWRTVSGIRILHRHTAQLRSDWIQAIRNRNCREFTEDLLSHDVFILDDLDLSSVGESFSEIIHQIIWTVQNRSKTLIVTLANQPEHQTLAATQGFLRLT